MGYRTQGMKRYAPSTLREYAALLDAGEALPLEPRTTTLSERIFETFYVYRDRINEEHLLTTKGFTGKIFQGSFVANQDRRTLAEFCKSEGWTEQPDGTWAGPTGKAKLDGSDVTFIVNPEQEVRQ